MKNMNIHKISIFSCCYHRFQWRALRKPNLFLFIFIVFIIGIAHPEQSVLFDFSLLPKDNTMNLFTVYYLPSMQRVPGAIKIKHADKTETTTIMEITIDFSNAPANTIGAAVLSPFVYTVDMESGIDEPDNLNTSKKERDLGNKVDGYGLVRNIGVLKSINIIAQSNINSNELCIILADQEEQDTLFFPEGFPGDQWRSIRYKNPDYIRDVRNLNFREFSSETNTLPYLRLKGLVIYKPEKKEDQKVFLLVQSISLDYDRAYLNYDNE